MVGTASREGDAEVGKGPRRGIGRLFAAGAVASAAVLFASPAFASSSSGLLAALGGGTNGLDVSSIAAKVDPGIVDINTTLDGGAAAGTGMVLTSSGIVLTNNHVINGETSVNVQVAGTGPTLQADVLGYDAADDVAVLKIEHASNLATVSTGDSSQVQVNDPVVALGNALGRGGTPATAQGSVTGVNQTITAADDNGANPETLTGMIEMNAPIQPGDSGGPLVGADGNVIGMTSAGSSGSGGLGGSSSTDGYAIPINHALDIANQIEAGRSSANVHIGARAILGVEIQAGAATTPGNGSGGFPGGNNSNGGSAGGNGSNGSNDPFGGSGSSGGSGSFGGNGSSGSNDPFGGSFSPGGFDPFGGSVSSGINGAFDPFGGGSSSGGFDPFGGSGSSGSNDPFGGSGSFGGSNGGAVSNSDGVQISGVESGGPAESAGLAAGDVITALDGHTVRTPDDIDTALNSHRPGDHVTVEWTDSSGQTHSATVTLVAGPPA